MLELPRNMGGVSSYQDNSTADVGIDRDAAQRWRSGALNAGELMLCQIICGRNLDLLGYRREPMAVGLGLALSVAYLLLLPLQLSVALVLNVSRHKSLLASIRRRMS